MQFISSLILKFVQDIAVKTLKINFIKILWFVSTSNAVFHLIYITNGHNSLKNSWLEMIFQIITHCWYSPLIEFHKNWWVLHIWECFTSLDRQLVFLQSHVEQNYNVNIWQYLCFKLFTILPVLFFLKDFFVVVILYFSMYIFISEKIWRKQELSKRNHIY